MIPTFAPNVPVLFFNHADGDRVWREWEPVVNSHASAASAVGALFDLVRRDAVRQESRRACRLLLGYVQSPPAERDVDTVKGWFKRTLALCPEVGGQICRVCSQDDVGEFAKLVTLLFGDESSKGLLEG